MTVNLSTTKIQYNGNGVLTSFVYTFRILEDDDLSVFVTSAAGLITNLVLNSDYTVTGAGNDSGGTVVLAAGTLCATGETLTIMRNMDLLQETDYVDGDAFSAESFEDAADKSIMVLQQVNERLGRSICAPPFSNDSMEIDGVEWQNRENKGIGFNVDGDLALLPTSLATVTVAPGAWINVADAPYNGSLTAVVAAIGGTEAVLLIDSVATLTADTVVLENIQLVVTVKGRINQGTYALTINSPFDPDIRQIFTGTGAVSGLKKARPEWFATNTTPGTTDMAPAILAASAASRTVRFSRDTYAIGSSLKKPTQSMWIGEFTGTVIKALSTLTTVPTITAATYSPVLAYPPMLYNESSMDYWGLENIEFDGNGQDVYGIYLVENYHGYMKNVLVYNTNQRPYTNIRGQTVTHNNTIFYGSDDGVLTYDNTNFTFIGSGFERLGGDWTYDQRQPNSFSKGGVTLINCWFESDSTHHPAEGFLRLSGRRNSGNAHFAFHTTVTTERMIELNDTTDSLVVDGITMGAQACNLSQFVVNDASSSMLVVAKAGTRANSISGNFLNTGVTDSGIGNTWDVSASLSAPIQHVTNRFQVRYGDTGSGVPISANSYVFDADYNSGDQRIRLFGNTIKISAHSGVPITGLISLYQRVLNSTPTVGQPKGWICTVAGGAVSATRANSTAYSLGVWATWTTGTTAWEVTTAGTSAGSPPSITGLVVGDTVTDGTIVWTMRSLTTATLTSEGNL